MLLFLEELRLLEVEISMKGYHDYGSRDFRDRVERQKLKEVMKMDLQEINEKQKDTRVDISEVIGIGVAKKDNLSEDDIPVADPKNIKVVPLND